MIGWRAAARGVRALAICISTSFPLLVHAQFALCPAQTGLPYGLTSLHFPQAWLKTCGNAYVGLIDNGIQVTHPQLRNDQLGNVRWNLSKDCTQNVGSDVPPFDKHCVRPGVIFNASQNQTEVSWTATIDEFPIGGSYRGHGTHTAGIIGAAPNGTLSGGCPRCSLMLFSRHDAIVNTDDPSSPTDDGTQTKSAIRAAYSSGAQVINLSAGTARPTTILNPQVIEALKRDIIFVAASGNSDRYSTSFGTPPLAIEYPANLAGVIGVGGVRDDPVTGLTFWTPESAPTITGKFGSASGPQQFVVAPGRHIFSTFYSGAQWDVLPGDLGCQDQSYPGASSYGYCSGTSMSTPHVSAVVALVRSVQPTLTAGKVKDIIKSTSTNPANPGGRSDDYGWGIPDAQAAVTAALGGPAVSNRKTPLFALNSTAESDHVFTTVPQVAMAANEGVLPPQPQSQDLTWPVQSMGLYASVGDAISGYTAFTALPCPLEYPSCTPTTWDTPRASASILTTPANPILGGPELLPLYRLSWRCGDSPADVPAMCQGSAPTHVKHFYTTDASEMNTMLTSHGYRLDGIEGYVYPPSQTSLPSDAVKLCRMYNITRDDFILYAGTDAGAAACNMAAGSLGDRVAATGPGTYSAFNTAFIGYAYPPGPPQAVSSAASIAKVGGDSQQTTVATAFANPLSVVVRDLSGNPVNNVTVSFSAPASGASATLTPSSTTTDVNGIATVSATANTVAGVNYPITVCVSNGNTCVSGLTVSFAATNVAGPPASIATGANTTPQMRPVNTAFAPLQVIVSDTYGNPVNGASVTYSATTTAGATANLSSGTATTDPQGKASVTATANGIGGGPYSVTAGVGGSISTTFVLKNQAPTTIDVQDGSPQRTLIGTSFVQPLRAIVRDQDTAPMSGVNVTFAVTGSGTGATLSQTSVLTDVDGFARVSATANTVGGSYAVVASVANSGLSTSFALTNQVPTTIGVVPGSSPQSAMVGAAFAQPLAAALNDQDGIGIARVSVDFAAPASGPSATLSAPSAVTSASGIAQVTATAQSAGGGPYAVTASYGALSTNFALTNTVPVPTTLELVDGTPQSALTGAAFALPLRVVVKDQVGHTMSGVTVGYAVVAGANGQAATLAAPSATDGNGIARVTATANGVSGSYVVNASVPQIPGKVISFELTNVQRVPAGMQPVANSTPQHAGVGTSFAAPLSVIVTDQAGAPLPNIAVSFSAVAASNGASATLSASSMLTDGSGVAAVNATANAIGGPYGVTASVQGIPSVSFALTNLVPTTFQLLDGSGQGATINTAFALPLRAIVKDQYGNPFDGASVTFLAPAGPATASLSPTSVVTGIDGIARAAATANGTAGDYNVMARYPPFPDVVFSLTNQPPNLFANGGFESPVVGPYGSGVTLSPWAFSGGAITGNGFGPQYGFPAPQEGIQTAWYWCYGSVYQTVNLAAGSYMVAFRATSGNQSTSPGSAHPVTLLVDGVAKGTVNTPLKTWGSFAIEATTLSTGAHTFQFVSDGSANFDMIMIDDVRLTLVPTSAVIRNGGFEQPVTQSMSSSANEWTGGGGGTGVTSNAYLAIYGAPPAPEGVQAGYLYYTGAGLQQSLELDEGFYYVSFKAAIPSNGTGAPVKLRLNGVVRATVNPPPGVWTTYALGIDVPSRGTYVLALGSDATGLAFVDDVQIAPAPADTNFRDGGFETPPTTNLGTLSYWAAASGGSISNNRFAVYGIAPAPQGTQAAYYSSSGSVWQTVALMGGTYVVSFYAASMNGTASPVKLRVDGVDRGSVATTLNAWGSYSITVPSLSTGFHVFTFASDPAAGGTVFLDAVNLSLVPTSVAISNGGFESPVTTSLGGIPSGWSSTGNTGTIANARLSLYNAPPAPEGGQAAYMNYATSGLDQTLNLPAGSFTVTFSAAVPNNGLAAGPVKVRFNGAELGTFVPPPGTWSTYSVPITAPTRGSYTLEIGSNGQGLVFVDNVTIQ